MAENDQSEQINRLLAQLRKEEGAAISRNEMDAMSQGDPTMQRQMRMEPGSAMSQGELNEAGAQQAFRKATRREPGSAIADSEMGAMMSKGVPMPQGQQDFGSPFVKQFPNEAEAFRKATRKESTAGITDGELRRYMEEELNLITTAQEGLMQLDPEGTRDVVQGLEVSKNRVMSGAALSPDEYTGISAILEQIANAFKGMMGGGESTTKTYMVDGRPVEMTEREMMGAKNAGILVQDPESAIRDMEMQQ